MRSYSTLRQQSTDLSSTYDTGTSIPTFPHPVEKPVENSDTRRCNI